MLVSAAHRGSSAFFTQVPYAEFEDQLHKTAEAGGPLGAEEISQLWYDLYNTYRGDTVKMFDDARYQWAAIPHFYTAYYVYQYATASYSGSLCQAITGGQEGSLKADNAFLALGGSMPRRIF